MVDRSFEHEQTKHLGVARAGGKAKVHLDAPVHPGMRTVSRTTGQVHPGGDALSRADADPASPIGGAPRGKMLADVKPVPGQRSRTSPHDPALGKAILAEALNASAPDDRMAFGKLPTDMKEY